MNSALTHLTAAGCGALLLLLILPGQDSPSPDSPRPSKPSKSDHVRFSTKRADDLLAKMEGRNPPASTEEDWEPLEEELMGPMPTRQQLEDYIKSRSGDPEALLAAGLILNDSTYLRSALAKDPDNPHILFALAASQDTSSEEKAKWCGRLTQLQPDNAMASYLMASRLYESGMARAALDVLQQSSRQSGFEDFSLQSALVAENAFRATGSDATQAKLRSSFRLPIHYTTDLGALASNLGSAPDVVAAGESEDVRAVLAAMGVRIAEDSPTQLLITELVGLSMQRRALDGLDGDAPSPYEGLSTEDANTSIEEQINEIWQASFPDPGNFINLPPGVLDGYLDRVRLFGELEAARWLQQRTTPPAGE